MYTHYSLVAEVARQRQAGYAAEAAAWRRHRALRRNGWWRHPFANRRLMPRPSTTAPVTA